MTVGIEFFLGLFIGCYLYFQGRNVVSALQEKVQKERVYKQRHDAIDDIVTKAEEVRTYRNLIKAKEYGIAYTDSTEKIVKIFDKNPFTDYESIRFGYRIITSLKEKAIVSGAMRDPVVTIYCGDEPGRQNVSMIDGDNPKRKFQYMNVNVWDPDVLDSLLRSIEQRGRAYEKE